MKNSKKTYIWSIPTRLFHWLFVFGIVCAYILSEDEEYLSFHISFGIMVGVLVLFRLIWGFIGPKYSRFTDFPIHPKRVIEFLKNVKNKSIKYAGHNPAASIVMLSILITSILIVITGVFNLSGEGNFINFSFVNQNEELYEELHEIFVNVLLGLVIFHLIGIAVDTFVEKKSAALSSIFTGYKNIKSEDVKLNNFQKTFSILWFLLSFSAFIYVYSNSKSLVGNEMENEIENLEDELETD